MALKNILSTLDREIAALQAARKLLSGTPDVMSTLVKRGRPVGSKNVPTVAPAEKRTMSAEGRAKIAEAQRKRHAAGKRAAKKRAVEPAAA